MATDSWINREKEIRATVAALADDPEGRYAIREKFYHRYGDVFTEHGKGLGNSELAFLRWEIERGVLNPLDHPTHPGSPWWRAVNLDFILQAELAAGAFEEKMQPEQFAGPIRTWLDYLYHQRPARWYRAHNHSIVSGYLSRIEEAKSEHPAEQYFVNEVLYRVLFAEAMAQGEHLAFGKLGKILANPRLISVDILVHLPSFYPRHYPLTAEDIRQVRHQGHNIREIGVLILDDLIILPKLSRLYAWASNWLEVHELSTWVSNDTPIYPHLTPPSGWRVHAYRWLIQPLFRLIAKLRSTEPAV